MRSTKGVVAACLVWAGAASAGGSTSVSLDGEWDFTWTPTTTEAVPTIPERAAFDATVEVPGKWDDQLDRLKSAGWFKSAQFTTTLGPVRYLTGIGWHRKVIDAPADWRGRAVRLTVGWAVGQTHVWLNGQHVGAHNYGVYTPYAVDLTTHIKPGHKNELIVSVDNTRGFAGGWAFLGNAGKASGISRPVALEVAAGPGRIADLYVKPGKTLRDVVCQVVLEVPGAGGRAPVSKLDWRILTADRRTVLADGVADVPAFGGTHQLTVRKRVEAIKPWSPEHPNLYLAELRWATADGTVWDTHVQRFGLRRWSYDGRKMKLNGRTVYLRGEFGAYYYPIHCTAPTSKEHWIRHITRAKQIGMNYINFAARVCPIELLEAADELGMIMQCGDHMTVLAEHAKHYKEVWTPLVRWTRRHPSMCLYGFGGERNYYEGIIEQYQRQHDLIKSLHPECLVMPQQAIRGVDYAFDAKGKRELTPKPFPHHAERLARYTKACDVFGHYSGGAFGYNYFAAPWREMEKRFFIYDKPLSMHELFMGMSYLDPDNAAKYTGRVPPYLYTQLREDLTEAGLLDRWRTYHANASRLHGICRKYCVEKTRKCNELAGFEFLGMTDMHFTHHYTTGILDEFRQLKPGDTIEGILRYNGQSVLLIDFADGSINRSFWSGEPFVADLIVSLYGEKPIENGTLAWTLKDGDHVALRGQFPVSNVANGGVSTLHKLKLTWPAVQRTTRLNLAVTLRSEAVDLANDWDFWVFPRRAARDVKADADEKARALLIGRYAGLGKLTRASSAKLRIVSRVGQPDVEHLSGGGDVLLLGTAPFLDYTAWRSFRPGLGAREHHNVGHVIRQHPIFADLPHKGWGDWQFYPVLEGAICVEFDVAASPFEPILEIISSAEDVRKHAAIFEKRVGAGRLLVSTCTFNAENPSCVALLDGILRYVSSDAFRPKHAVSPATLTRMAAPVDAGCPSNLVTAPGFEFRDRPKRNWSAYGEAYQIDTTIAHGGSQSLKIAVTPQAIKNSPGIYTGARAKNITFKRTPPVMKLSAWHKTKGLSGASGNSFLIFVYITYKGGGRHTLRMHFDQRDHDWQLAEKTWKPAKPLARATLYIGMGHQSGTAWFDDVYFGPVTAGEVPPVVQSKEAWSREPVTVDFGVDGLVRIDAGAWSAGRTARIVEEGVHEVAFKKAQDDKQPTVRVIRIDTTPPLIELSARPALTQEGGVYGATLETEFIFQASDNPSGVKGIEISIDGGDFVAHTAPLRLAKGEHELRCRVTDMAGNVSKTIAGQVLTGGHTDVLMVNVR